MPPPARTIAEHAYAAYCAALDTPQPAYADLPSRARFAWAQAVHAGVCEAQRLPDEVSPPLPVAPPLPAELDPAPALALVITGMRQEVRRAMTDTQRSLKGMSRAAGVDRRTLARWMQGEENVSVQTLQRLAAWLPTVRSA